MPAKLFWTVYQNAADGEWTADEIESHGASLRLSTHSPLPYPPRSTVQSVWFRLPRRRANYWHALDGL